MNINRPLEIKTERLIIRSFIPTDAPAIQILAGDFEIANNTLSIPHPYETGMAEKWLSDIQKDIKEGTGVFFAITMISSGELIGTIGLKDINREHDHAELGYWIGKKYWNKGYATEAARAIIDYSFTELKLKRVYAFHFTRNPASGSVLNKIGMKYEGTLKSHIKKWDKYEDIAAYGIVNSVK